MMNLSDLLLVKVKVMKEMEQIWRCLLLYMRKMDEERVCSGLVEWRAVCWVWWGEGSRLKYTLNYNQ